MTAPAARARPGPPRVRPALGPALALALALAAAASLALAGCGEQRGQATRTVPEPLGPASTAQGRAVATADVSLVDFALRTADSRVRRAGLVAVVATNDGLRRHALAVDGPSGTARTPALRPGQRATLRMRLPPGTYKWYCPLSDHERRGMVGRLRVAE